MTSGEEKPSRIAVWDLLSAYLNNLKFPEATGAKTKRTMFSYASTITVAAALISYNLSPNNKLIHFHSEVLSAVRRFLSLPPNGSYSVNMSPLLACLSHSYAPLLQHSLAVISLCLTAPHISFLEPSQDWIGTLCNKLSELQPMLHNDALTCTYLLRTVSSLLVSRKVSQQVLHNRIALSEMLQKIIPVGLASTR